MEKKILDSLRGQSAHPVPIWLMRQAGRYLPEYRQLRQKAGGFMDLCLTPDLATEVTLQPVRRFGLDAAILFSDILMVPHGLGGRVEFHEGQGPLLQPLGELPPVFNPQRFAERTAPIMQTLRQVKEQLDPGVALIGFAGAPWTVACYMLQGKGGDEFRQARSQAYANPARLASLLDVLVEATTNYLINQIEAGADIVQIFDSWAGLVPPENFDAWVIQPTRRITDMLRVRFPNLPVIGFPRGAGLMIESYADQTGVTALGLDSSVPLAFARDKLQTRLPVQGNLDPMALLAGGAALREGVQRILEHLGSGPLIFNLGHGVIKETPPEHVAELVDLVRAHG